LAKFISTKETEVEFFMENFVGKTAAGKIVLEAINGAASSLEGSLMGSEHVTPHVLKELQALKEMAGLYTSQAVALGFAAHRSTLERKMKKMSLVETTQVEMTDSISTATIEKVVNDALKRHSTSFSRKRKNTGEFDDSNDPMLQELTLVNRPAKACKTTKGQHPRGTPPPWPSSFEETQGRGTRQSRRERAKGKEEREVQEMMDLRPRFFSVRNRASYPDSFVSASLSSRVSFIVLNSSLSFLSSVRSSQPGVFKGPGVFILYVFELYVKKEFSLTIATPSTSRFLSSILVLGINFSRAFSKTRRSLRRGMLVYIALTSPLHSMTLVPRGNEGITTFCKSLTNEMVLVQIVEKESRRGARKWLRTLARGVVTQECAGEIGRMAQGFLWIFGMP
jgi:hypothetical protein